MDKQLPEQTTAMQDLIKWMQSRISDRPTPNDYEQGKETAYELAIDMAITLLQKEKDQLAGATSSSTVKAKDERIKQLEDGIKWALDNPQSVFVFNELQKLL